ncbi:Uma2 family endonuclease [Hydrogenobacter sp. T-2]|uniref:Uma2 family endonuclease n=1 Tax=Pampinifervens diazotrophicum TaxID=1632018 RepID=UPI002B2594DA|nr:Uma2 family endonuclease [Hydrogenobacter sp. T-2]WPM31916.1 Uma2 family endonuclease [Hydrogenobacter sp. T-2]
MKTVEKLYTYQDLVEGKLPEGLYEIVNGEVVEMAPTSFDHGWYELDLGAYIRGKLRIKGYTAVGEVGILIRKKPLTIRAVDVVYISKEKVKEKPKGILQVPPDLVIEILSPSNTYTEMEEKVQELLDFGVERVLLVDPRLRKAFLHKKGIVEVYSFDEEFELLPELKIKLSEVL